MALGDGRDDWVAEVAVREDVPTEKRRHALEALMAFPRFRGRALAAMAAILEAAKAPADLRIWIVYQLGEDDAWRDLLRPREILERAAREDPSVYVRDAAGRMVNPR